MLKLSKRISAYLTSWGIFIKMKDRVVVAMSGGVDSSVAACLLKEQGHEVVGITMSFPFSKQSISDARKVARKLGIRHYALSLQKDLNRYVIKDFCRQYLSGRTPNPCVRCNQYLKFGALLKKALALDAQYLATGHYVKVIGVRSQVTGHRSQEFILKKAKDKTKDQSYFLYRLNQNQLKHTIFPLANYTKSEVRQLARRFSLPVADKLDSQEICFLRQTDYRNFLKANTKTKIKPGFILDKHGQELGRHKGIPYYTIGQREGVGIALGYPAYIIEINPQTNTITIGSKEDAYKTEFLVSDTHFISTPIKKKVALRVKIRYNHKEALAEVIPFEHKLKVKFKISQFAITPGQAAVFYDNNRVLGGGIIERVLD